MLHLSETQQSSVVIISILFSKKCATLWVVKDGIHGTDLNKSKSFEDGAIEIIEAFHSKKNTYRALPDLTPTFITPHFRW